MDARVNITYGGNNGDLPDTVSFDATDAEVLGWVTEAVRGGGVPGIAADPGATFADFVVDRFNATEARPYNLIQVRPKTPFGAEADGKKGNRIIYFIPSDGYVPGLGWRVSLVREGEGGHNPTGGWPYDGKDHGKDMAGSARPLFWGGTIFSDAEEVAEAMNKRFGYDELAVSEVIMSAMSSGAKEVGGRPFPDHPIAEEAWKDAHPDA